MRPLLASRAHGNGWLSPILLLGVPFPQEPGSRRGKGRQHGNSHSGSIATVLAVDPNKSVANILDSWRLEEEQRPPREMFSHSSPPDSAAEVATSRPFRVGVNALTKVKYLFWWERCVNTPSSPDTSEQQGIAA